MSTEITKKENNALATQGGFATSADMEWLNEAMNEDCAGIELQLDRIKIPAGGSIRNEIYNVGCMYWNYEPVTLDEIITHGKTIRPNYGTRTTERRSGTEYGEML